MKRYTYHKIVVICDDLNSNFQLLPNLQSILRLAKYEMYDNVDFFAILTISKQMK